MARSQGRLTGLRLPRQVLAQLLSEHLQVIHRLLRSGLYHSIRLQRRCSEEVAVQMADLPVAVREPELVQLAEPEVTLELQEQVGLPRMLPQHPLWEQFLAVRSSKRGLH